MERDGFLFKRAWRDALAGLPLQVRQEVYEAIIEYGCSGTQIPLKARAGAAFALIRKEIDLYRQREGEISCRRSMAGRMGGTATQAKGRQRAEENEADKQNQANQANACFAFPAANPPAASRTRIEEDNNNNIRNDDIIDNQKIKKENAQKKEEKDFGDGRQKGDRRQETGDGQMPVLFGDGRQETGDGQMSAQGNVCLQSPVSKKVMSVSSLQPPVSKKKKSTPRASLTISIRSWSGRAPWCPTACASPRAAARPSWPGRGRTGAGAWPRWWPRSARATSSTDATATDGRPPSTGS